MLTDPLTLFDQTIDNLETLAALLADELDERVQGPQLDQQSVSIPRAAHSKIRMLLPILRAARTNQEHFARTKRAPYCIDCD